MKKESAIYEDLRAKIKEINDLFRKSLIDLLTDPDKKLKRELQDKVKIFKFDFVNDEKRELEISEISTDNKKLIYAETKEIEGETPGDNAYINYYWIEYDDINNNRKKVTWFFKSYDKNYHNLHVIPGVLQQWERKNIGDNKDFPILKADTGELVDIAKRKGDPNHTRFIERVDNFDWVPITDWPFTDKTVITMEISDDMSIKIENPRELYDRFFQDYIGVSGEYLKEIKGKLEKELMDIKMYRVSRGHKEDSSKKIPDYRILAWINCKKNNTIDASFYFYRHKIYRQGGFLTLFGRCGFAPENPKCYSNKYNYNYDEWFCSNSINETIY